MKIQGKPISPTKQEGARIAAPVLRSSLSVSATSPLQVFLATYDRPHGKPVYDMHYAVEIGVVRRGCMRRFFDGFRHDYHPGDIWFCSMLEPHGMQVMQVPCEVFVMVAWPPMFNETRFPEAPGLNWMAPFLLPPGQRPRSSALDRRETLQQVNRLIADQALPDIQHHVRRRLHLLELLLPFASRAGAMAGGISRVSGSSSRIAPALALLDGCRERITMDKAARSCGLGKEAFSKEFRSLLGLSFVQFNLRRRLSGVAGDLASGTAPVKAIASDWGFTDSSHLDRLFSRQYGCPPQQYRDRQRG